MLAGEGVSFLHLLRETILGLLQHVAPVGRLKGASKDEEMSADGSRSVRQESVW